MTLLEKLTPLVAKLNGLLQDPQPGLASWCIMVAETWEQIAKLWEPTV